MGYLTIDKFDLRSIERALADVKASANPNQFTHLINPSKTEMTWQKG
jgi:hypothetical protein